MSILHIIQTGCTNLHFWFFMTLYKDAIQDRNLHLCSSTKYCTNANNPLKKWLLLKNHARLSSIHKPASLDIKFFWYFYHVIWVENHKNWVYLFTGHPVCIAHTGNISILPPHHQRKVNVNTSQTTREETRT